jgi:hypothetical protein
MLRANPSTVPKASSASCVRRGGAGGVLGGVCVLPGRLEEVRRWER